jgi:iron-sulfur cluster repair protein YtfE (RIC family)
MILITRALAAEHKMFCFVFDQIEELLTSVSNIGEVKQLTRLVEGLLSSHAKTEDDLMMLLEHKAAATEASCSKIYKEHHEMDAKLIRVYAAQKADQGVSLLRAAMTSSRRHFAREERIVFPLIEQMIDAQTLMRLGTSWFLRNHSPHNWTI